MPNLYQFWKFLSPRLMCSIFLCMVLLGKDLKPGLGSITLHCNLLLLLLHSQVLVLLLLLHIKCDFQIIYLSNVSSFISSSTMPIIPKDEALI